MKFLVVLLTILTVFNTYSNFRLMVYEQFVSYPYAEYQKALIDCNSSRTFNLVALNLGAKKININPFPCGDGVQKQLDKVDTGHKIYQKWELGIRPLWFYRKTKEQN